jgi:hypothetical protein
MENKNVVVLGASTKPERYSNKAMKALAGAGYNAIPVNPGQKEIECVKCYRKLSDVKEKVHTITLYVSPEHVEKMADEIIALKPERIISNPGSETDIMAKKARDAGILYMEACTLVLLSTGDF